ncbi:hypothetical protein ACJ41P_10705 [Azospirillum argentinense]|uniref:Uncharacterized protein n=1 Tax=Azospirillum argentinense TaxID=2970906 RepID=A0ABW8V608_9PROT
MNLPDVAIIADSSGAPAFIAVVSSGYPDRFPGAYWRLFDMKGEYIAGGQSKGWDGQGAGSMLSAMTNAKSAAKRRLRPSPTTSVTQENSNG